MLNSKPVNKRRPWLTYTHFRFSYEKLLIILLILQVFCVQWLFLTKYYSIALDIFLVLYLFHKKIKKEFVFAFLLFILYIAVEFITSASFKPRVFLYNMRYILCSILVIIFIGVIAGNKKNVEKIFSSLFYVINGYMVLNIPVLLLELNDHFFWSGRHSAENVNLFKPDLISGLFGYNGTPMLGMFSCFFFIYDLWYYQVKLSKKRRKSFMVYYFLMLAFYLFISVPNDNKSFYVFLALSYGIYFLSVQNNYQKLKEKTKGFRKGIFLALAGILLFLVIYNSYAPFQRKIDLSMRIITSALSGSFDEGSSERFAMINYYFKKIDNKIFGTGFTTTRWKEKEAYGFVNFGQSDMGAFLIIGGLALVVCLLLIVYSCLRKMNKSRFVSIIELLFMIFSMIMTLPITSTSITISIMFLFLICSLGNREYA